MIKNMSMACSFLGLLSLSVSAMEQKAPVILSQQELLKKIKALYVPYTNKSHFMGRGQHMVALPNEPFNYLQHVHAAIEGDRKDLIPVLTRLIAGENSCNELLDILLSAGADPNQEWQEEDGVKKNLLWVSMSKSQKLENAELLLSRGAKARIAYPILDEPIGDPRICLLLRYGQS